MNAYYQTVNRLAHLLFLRKQGVDAWLASVYFVGDWHRRTSEPDWRDASRRLVEETGLSPDAPHSASVRLDAKPLTALALPAAVRRRGVASQ